MLMCSRLSLSPGEIPGTVGETRQAKHPPYGEQSLARGQRRTVETQSEAEARRPPERVRFEWVPSEWPDLATKGNKGKEDVVPVQGERAVTTSR